jgi:hypothetical protein
MELGAWRAKNMKGIRDLNRFRCFAVQFGVVQGGS